MRARVEKRSVLGWNKSLETADPDGKIMIPLLPDDASTVPMVTLLLPPIVPEMTVFNSSAPELVMPLPNPIVPVTPLTYTSLTVVEPDQDAKDSSPPMPHDDDPYFKEAPHPGTGEKLRPNTPYQCKTAVPNTPQ